MFTGPNIVRDGLVLALDAASIKSFKGPSQTNLITRINHSYGTSDTATFKTNSGTLDVNIPKRGRRTVKYLDIYNDYNGGSGVCCPNLFNFGDFTVSSSTTYVYSIVYKSLTGYTHPNYMYRYEYNGGTYVTEGGVHSTSNRTALGDGWYHAWGTFTTQATTNRLITYLFHYEYGTYNTVFVESVQITQGSYIGAPEHMLAPSENRGTTVATGGGWVDRSGNSNHGELVNGPTYNSNGLGGLVFDGTNDHIQIANDVLSTNSPFTLEGWIKPNGSSWGNNSFPLYNTYRNSSSIGFWHHFGTDNILRWRHAGSSYTTGDLSGIGLVANVWQLTTITWDGDTLRLYKNGLLQNSTSAAGGYNTSSTTGGRIGMLSYRSNGSDYNWNGTIGTNLVYNRALTASEVLQNYNATKGRFGL